MSPPLQDVLESKAERRKRLMALPHPEKVRIVAQMRAAAREIKAAASGTNGLREESAHYRVKSP
jgi:hypothetical protein